MQITRAEHIRIDGYPYLEMVIDDHPALISGDAKRTILEEFGAVYLGHDWEERIPPVILPPDPAQSRYQPEPLEGFTQDPGVIRLVRRYIRQVDTGRFVEGPVSID